MLDLDAFEQRVSTILAREGASLASLDQVQGGASGLTYLATIAGALPARRIVIKVAPSGIQPTGHRDVLRQARLLHRLAAVKDIPVPSVLFEDRGNPPEIPPLYAMEYVHGIAFEPNKDALSQQPDPALFPDLDARATAAAIALARLHALRIGALDLEHEPVIGPAEELGRWHRLFEKIGDPDPMIPRVFARLQERLPARLSRPALLHGDFRLGNMLCRGSEILAIIDWEIWSVGDPRIDLGWFLLTFQPDLHPLAVRRAPGLPGADAILRIYEQHRFIMPDLDWFRALALYKMSASVALIVRNARLNGTFDERSAFLAARMSIMLERALQTFD